MNWAEGQKKAQYQKTAKSKGKKASKPMMAETSEQEA